MDLLPIRWKMKVKKLDVIIIRYDTNRDGVGINILIIIIDMCIILSSLMPSLLYKTLRRMNEMHLGTLNRLYMRCHSWYFVVTFFATYRFIFWVIFNHISTLLQDGDSYLTRALYQEDINKKKIMFCIK